MCFYQLLVHRRAVLRHRPPGHHLKLDQIQKPWFFDSRRLQRPRRLLVWPHARLRFWLPLPWWFVPPQRLFPRLGTDRTGPTTLESSSRSRSIDNQFLSWPQEQTTVGHPQLDNLSEQALKFRLQELGTRCANTRKNCGWF
jgi:hypothetical protein